MTNWVKTIDGKYQPLESTTAGYRFFWEDHFEDLLIGWKVNKLVLDFYYIDL